jgi:tripartite-type tricarboxylate transporter receptor subunit TctC
MSVLFPPVLSGLKIRQIGQAFGLAASAAVALLLSMPVNAQAQSNYPSRPIHIVVPYPAGGIVDIVARAVMEQVGRDLKQSIVVEDRPGANGNIGTAAVARSEPDGYTWLVTGPALLVNPSLYKDAGWDPTQSFKCVGLAVWNQIWHGAAVADCRGARHALKAAMQPKPGQPDNECKARQRL